MFRKDTTDVACSSDDLHTVYVETDLAALWTEDLMLNDKKEQSCPGSARCGLCPAPFTVPMGQIGNHIRLSGKIYVTRANGSGQGSWLPSQSDSSLYFRGVAILFRSHPRPRVIFSGDYNTPPLSPRNAHGLLSVWWNTMAYHFHFALTSFFPLSLMWL